MTLLYELRARVGEAWRRNAQQGICAAAGKAQAPFPLCWPIRPQNNRSNRPLSPSPMLHCTIPSPPRPVAHPPSGSVAPQKIK